ncbi:Os06g0196550 [Oryza sativa Japonica Group]|uniref:Os06g0196550 protein n=1 Tax=Oryza sativa subsp. japonica TaxID=39947 RepID=A0A0P0WTX1_ORYSJ|nr:hypothetical protein EE612_032464 [Oryza sativa]BAS96615.1 Os06g0196550 [Oryza sativa Japonica Group]
MQNNVIQSSQFQWKMGVPKMELISDPVHCNVAGCQINSCFTQRKDMQNNSELPEKTFTILAKICVTCSKLRLKWCKYYN